MASSNAFSKQEESVKIFPLDQEKIVIKKLQIPHLPNFHSGTNLLKILTLHIYVVLESIFLSHLKFGHS